MKTVEIDKDDLASTIRANRQVHKDTFEKALQGFQKTALEQVESMLERARKGLKQSLFLSLVIPEDHTIDYNRVLTMLDMEVNQTVTLTEEEFAKYVMDDWEWKNQWTTTASAYLSQSQ